MTKKKNNNEFVESRTDYIEISKKNRRKNIVILVLFLLVIFLGLSLYYFKYLDRHDVGISEEISEDSSSSSKTKESTSNSYQNVATKELESNYADEDIEFARVVANVGQNKNMYTLENVENSKISIFGKKGNDGNNFITIMENGQNNVETNRHIFYIPLGEGYIEHSGIRKYPTPPNSPMDKIYLETEYDDIALEILKNSSNFTDNKVLSEGNKSVDLDSMLNRDFSSISGTWKNGDGDVLTINNDGSTSRGQRIIINSEQNVGEMITGGIGIEGQPGGAGISILDVGVSFPNIVDNSDNTKVRIIIAQQVWEFTAAAYFYKVQE